ncbi:MAG: glycosyl hydrolase family 28-related protein [Mucilaginibacter sp.]|uniref:glycosyl hydrolase family 28-related protein n=1 Tax=Mucilaginibacter sp. TaxID=1882438 RepID=UPI0031AB1B25
MKNTIYSLIALVFLMTSCTKNEHAVPPQTISKKQKLSSTNTQVSVKDFGAVGDGTTDDTQAIKTVMAYAKTNNIQTVYFPSGTYYIKGTGSVGIIPLLNGVSLVGEGRDVCKIKLSSGRFNPPALFFQAWWDEPAVSNVTISGIDFDGDIAHQTYMDTFQYCHALSINNGENINVNNCRFENFRGDGVLFGDVNEPSLNLRIVKHVVVHDNDFKSIYREGAMFCTTNSAEFYNNYVHGTGYLVGGVDIERHSVHEQVTNVYVHNNIFDFRDGTGPIERGKIVKYRRAVAIGFFYDGYTNNTADTLSGGHKIDNNTIYQGQIDCYNHINVSIIGNTFSSTNEDLSGVTHVTAPAILVSNFKGNEIGLINVHADNNNITTTMPNGGISFKGYTNCQANGNTLTGATINMPAQDGIALNNTIH